MAVASNGGQSNGKRRIGRFRPMSEINVTPLVDVMLVLLVIFMITAPLLTVGVPVNLPQEKSRPLTGDEEPLTVTIDRAGKIYLQETPVEIDELVPRLTAIAANGYDQRVYVRGDRNVNYGTVMSVMARMSDAGFTRIGLVNEQPGEQPKTKSRG
jgi:biopolymer transport protein TolR